MIVLSVNDEGYYISSYSNLLINKNEEFEEGEE